MATIKAIEVKSVHQIQSGQVIVDLCSVVKELVENSLDAGATSVEVRFKNNGLDSIEVQDNGSGIATSNYANVALKHYTSKLSEYDDLSTLQTFGFRGEAISSLCALSHFSIITAQADEAPKGNRLEFEISGALKSTTTTACQRGTTAIVEGLFETLPVRRKELSKNIKREYGKVLGLLHAYACIGVNVKLTVKNTMPKAKSMVVFSTQGNTTTRENIANVYGAKTLQALAQLNLELEFQPTLTQMVREEAHVTNVKVIGHISRPVFGEGRQTPDRQMFFVNGRPCGLPQIAKAINEVYRSFNVSQSPFIFADFILDTTAYDVNVSPDKRSIMLHNAAALIERLKECLTEMFDKHEQTVPQSQVPATKMPAFRQLNVQRQPSVDSPLSEQPRRSSAASNTSSKLQDDDTSLRDVELEEDIGPQRLFHDHFRAQVSTREDVDPDKQEKLEDKVQKVRERRAGKVAEAIAKQAEMSKGIDEYDDVRDMQEEAPPADGPADPHAVRVRDFNARMAEEQRQRASEEETPQAEGPIPALSQSTSKEPAGAVQNAFDRMRPRRSQAEIAEITIDGKTTTTVIGSQLPQASEAGKQARSGGKKANIGAGPPKLSHFSQSIRKFGAPGTQGAEQELAPIEGADDQEDDGPREELQDDTSADDGSGLEEERQRSRPDTERLSDEADSDLDYIDDAEKKAEEQARVAELIRQAEESAAMPSKENIRRANKALKGGQVKDSTVSLLTSVDASLEQLKTQMEELRQAMRVSHHDQVKPEKDQPIAKDEELRLSLTVSKDDFARMRIVGQFNLGFILAVRPRLEEGEADDVDRNELFIIDQHASDEKYNFERLQAETIVGNQRMVRPVNLSLTAVEEEVVLENTDALEKNGFVVEVDTSGTSPVGRRVTLTSLPLSKETTFDTRDMDELIHMLSESPMLGTESTVPRPTRVRKMFAMRACRSSIMIGKTLSTKQMETVVTHMGTIDKPWNCPHGRPTMRHVTSLDGIGTWQEGDGIIGLEEGSTAQGNVWSAYI